DDRGRAVPAETLLVLMNGGAAHSTFTLPAMGPWKELINTARPPRRHRSSTTLDLGRHALVLLQLIRPDDAGHPAPDRRRRPATEPPSGAGATGSGPPMCAWKAHFLLAVVVDAARADRRRRADRAVHGGRGRRPALALLRRGRGAARTGHAVLAGRRGRRSRAGRGSPCGGARVPWVRRPPGGPGG